MSEKHNSGYAEHGRASDLQDHTAYACSVAAAQSEQDHHMSSSEMSRQGPEHATAGHQRTAAADHHTSNSFGHAEIAALAYELWVGRGCPKGSSDQDWFLAARQLRARFGEK